jgi:uncharacterized protein
MYTRYSEGMAQTALITGASSGIGLEISKLFAADGFNVVLVARRQETLEKIAEDLRTSHGIKTAVVACDLSEPEAADRLVGELRTRKIDVDILVNNAGFGNQGLFHEIPADRDRALVQVNVAALTDLTKLLVPGMVDRKQGRILNLASTAAFQPGPLMAAYYASKAYVLSFSVALADELAPFGVTVTALCPGPTDTGFAGRAGVAGKRLFRDTASVEEVARKGYAALMAGKTVEVVGTRNKVWTFLTRFFPRRIAAKVARSVQE